MEALVAHPSLLSLDLGYSPSTKVLGAIGNCIGELGLVAIFKMLRQNRVLRKLDLRRSGVEKKSLDLLFNSIVENHSDCQVVLDQPMHRATNACLNNGIEEPLTSYTSDVSRIRSVYR